MIDRPDSLPGPLRRDLLRRGREGPGRVDRPTALGVGRGGALPPDGRAAAQGQAAGADRRGLVTATGARIRPGPGGAGPGPDRRPDLLVHATDWAAPDLRTMLWSTDGGMLALAAAKRRPDRPYVVGQWCNQTLGAWSFPTEAADMLLGVHTAAAEDWDALVRRGVFLYPVTWGAGRDRHRWRRGYLPDPRGRQWQPAHLRPLAACGLAVLPVRGGVGRSGASPPVAVPAGTRPGGGAARIPGWDPAHGRLVIDTPFTQALAGWVGREPAKLDHLDFSTENDFAVLAATSIGPEPIASAKRLLVTAIARVEPDRLPLGPCLAARGGRSGPSALPPGTRPGPDRLASQGDRARLRARMRPANASGRPRSRSSPTGRASSSSSMAGRAASTGSWSSNEDDVTGRGADFVGSHRWIAGWGTEAR